MKEATAQLNSYRQSPRKVRVVANLVRGKSVGEALDLLTFVPKRAGLPLKKLLSSAVANARGLSMGENLVVKKITVDAGKILYRRLPMAHGRAFPMRKRTSQVSITVTEGPKTTKREDKKAAHKRSSKAKPKTMKEVTTATN